jgi:hypothetical protein
MQRAPCAGVVRLGLFGVVLLLSGCASVAKATLQDRFVAIGIPRGTADCMVDELDRRLSSQDMQDLARYTVRLTRADSTVAAIRALMQIENPRAVSAVGSAGVACVTGLRL